jgi:hypothetical protein
MIIGKQNSHNCNYLQHFIAELQASVPACESHQQAPIYKAFERKKCLPGIPYHKKWEVPSLKKKYSKEVT